MRAGEEDGTTNSTHFLSQGALPFALDGIVPPLRITSETWRVRRYSRCPRPYFSRFAASFLYFPRVSASQHYSRSLYRNTYDAVGGVRAARATIGEAPLPSPIRGRPQLQLHTCRPFEAHTHTVAVFEAVTSVSVTNKSPDDLAMTTFPCFTVFHFCSRLPCTPSSLVLGWRRRGKRRGG